MLVAFDKDVLYGLANCLRAGMLLNLETLQ